VKRSEGQARLALAAAGERDAALRRYAALAAELEAAVAAAGQADSWKLEAAEDLVSLLLEETAAELHADVTAVTRDALAEALTSGPAALDRLAAGLAERMRQAQEPEEKLRALRARRRCLELRMRCLDHLEAVFETRRSQP
jgi:hypothetical protein